MKRAVVRGVLGVSRLAGRFVLRSGLALRLVLRPGHEAARWRIGAWQAWGAYELARREVPAYRDFLARHGDPEVPFRGWIPDLSVVPVTDKGNYVKAFSIEARCKGGAIPGKGVMVDESSGTSGMPNNWVRGRAERDAVTRILQLAMRHQFGDKPIFVLNAFALGPWATGMNVSMSVVDIAILKSTGPDLEKIANTLRLFGPSYRYVVMGYPPFLKALADMDLDWGRHDVTAIFGGEGLSEGARDYLLQRFRKVYGSYGASDLEINLAAENDYTIGLRRLLEAEPALRERIARPGPLPMVFQYNPLDTFVETNADGELVVTLTRPANIAPKIRYNIHDLGHVVRVPDLLAALRGLGLEGRLPPLPSELPLLFHYGRSDQAVAYYGCKLAPADVEQAIFRTAGLSERITSFALLVAEEAGGDKRLTVALESRPGTPPPADLEAVRAALFVSLAAVNQDFRESIRMVPAGLEPQVAFHAAGAGPFEGHDIRLKRRYIQPQ
ncbi:MAG: hypothetical protein QOD77_1705 [Thermoplasmata archaeon]|nr:hypothetical protein [Thermoplasmata archaeon]